MKLILTLVSLLSFANFSRAETNDLHHLPYYFNQSMTATLGGDKIEDLTKELKKYAGKIGVGMYYVNGKKALRASRRCALILADIETEATDRDFLMIGFTGKEIGSEERGFSNMGHEVNGEIFMESPAYAEAYGNYVLNREGNKSIYTYNEADETGYSVTVERKGNKALITITANKIAADCLVNE